MISALLALLLFAAPPQEFRTEETQTASERTLRMQVYQPEFAGAPTLVIAHGWAGSAERWQPIAQQLKRLGFGIILFNFRGHAGDQPPWYTMSNETVATLQEDLEAVVAHALRKNSNISLLGSGLSANLALMVAANNTGIRKVIAVSPAVDYRGLRLSRSLLGNITVPVMLVYSKEDGYSQYSSDLIARALPRQPNVQVYANAGQGVWILKRVPESLATIARWLSADPS